MGFFADQVLQVYVWFERLLCLYRLYETGLKVIVKIQLFFLLISDFVMGCLKTFSMIFSGSIPIIKLYIVKIVVVRFIRFFFSLHHLADKMLHNTEKIERLRGVAV